MYPPTDQGIGVGMVWLLVAVGLLVQGFVIYAAVRLALKHHVAMVKREEVVAERGARRQVENAEAVKLKQEQKQVENAQMVKMREQRLREQRLRDETPDRKEVHEADVPK